MRFTQRQHVRHISPILGNSLHDNTCATSNKPGWSTPDTGHFSSYRASTVARNSIDYPSMDRRFVRPVFHLIIDAVDSSASAHFSTADLTNCLPWDVSEYASPVSRSTPCFEASSLVGSPYPFAPRPPQLWVGIQLLITNLRQRHRSRRQRIQQTSKPDVPRTHNPKQGFRALILDILTANLPKHPPIIFLDEGIRPVGGSSLAA